MVKEIFSEGIQRIELVDLFAKWSNAPYGMPKGLHPIIFTAFYLRYQDELFLYRENTFIPEVQTAHLELLQRRPDLFSVSGGKARRYPQGSCRTLGQRFEKTCKNSIGRPYVIPDTKYTSSSNAKNIAF